MPIFPLPASASIGSPRSTSLPIIRHSVSDQVLDQLRRKLVRSEFPENSFIPESQYAQSIGVSRVPVREALMQLERDGLLTQTTSGTRGKSVVRAFTTNDVQQISAVRRELEGLAARIAASSATKDDLTQLQLNIEAFDAASSVEELAHLDVQFHELICLSAHQPWLHHAWQTIRWPFETILVRGFRNYVHETSLDDSKTATPDHTRILEAIRQHDAVTAETLLRQHISRWEEWDYTA
ncbi:MAG: GntR family transcriptional regulator [Verrucomicrobiota bacterium]